MDGVFGASKGHHTPPIRMENRGASAPTRFRCLPCGENTTCSKSEKSRPWPHRSHAEVPRFPPAASPGCFLRSLGHGFSTSITTNCAPTFGGDTPIGSHTPAIRSVKSTRRVCPGAITLHAHLRYGIRLLQLAVKRAFHCCQTALFFCAPTLKLLAPPRLRNGPTCLTPIVFFTQQDALFRQ